MRQRALRFHAARDVCPPFLRHIRRLATPLPSWLSDQWGHRCHLHSRDPYLILSGPKVQERCWPLGHGQEKLWSASFKWKSESSRLKKEGRKIIPFSPGWSQMLQKISSTDLCHHSELLCTASQRTCTHDLQNVLLEKTSFSWLVFSKHKFNFCGIKLVFSSQHGLWDCYKNKSW